MKTTHSDDFLRAALAGYEQQARDICAKMEAIRQQLRGRTKEKPADPVGPVAAQHHKKHRISASGRERIRQAQILRWSKTKTNKATA